MLISSTKTRQSSQREHSFRVKVWKVRSFCSRQCYPGCSQETYTLVLQTRVLTLHRGVNSPLNSQLVNETAASWQMVKRKTMPVVGALILVRVYLSLLEFLHHFTVFKSSSRKEDWKGRMGDGAEEKKKYHGAYI